MSRKPFLFLAVGDDDWLSRHKDRLHAEFEINIYRSGQECQAALADRQPEALVLDLRLADCDTFALHQAIRDDFMTSDVYQLLICTDADAARDGFVGDDFLNTPCIEGALWQKLLLLKKFLIAKDQTREQMSYAQNVALTAMSSMGELGVVMQFLSKSFGFNDISAVTALCLETLRQFDLSGVIHVIWEGDSYTATTEGGEPADSDRQFIDQMRAVGRIMEIEQRLVINYDHVSILVTNLPDDPVRCGRIRDNLATLAEGFESRVRGLLLENDNLLKQQGIRFAVGELRDSVKSLYVRQLADTEDSHRMVSQVIDHFEEAFVQIGLDPQTENKLINLLLDLRQGVTAIIDRPDEVNEKLHIVVMSLEALAGDITKGAAHA